MSLTLKLLSTLFKWNMMKKMKMKKMIAISYLKHLITNWTIITFTWLKLELNTSVSLLASSLKELEEILAWIQSRKLVFIQLIMAKDTL